MEDLLETLKAFIHDRLLGKFEVIDHEIQEDEVEGTYITATLKPVVEGSIGEIIAGLDEEALQSLYISCYEDEPVFEADIPLEDLLEFQEEMEERLEDEMERE